MTPESEYRGFVFKRKLNALTQASDLLFFKKLQSDQFRSLVQNKILEAFDLVKDKIPFENAVLDFVYLEDQEKVYIIEMNTYQTSTGMFTDKIGDLVSCQTMFLI